MKIRGFVLRRLLRVSGWLLGILGMSCSYETAAPTYGPPPGDFNLTIQGRIASAEDSTGIEGVWVQVHAREEYQWVDEATSDQSGQYSVTVPTSDPSALLDSVLVETHPGYSQGSWVFEDTVLYVPYIGSETLIELDLYLEPDTDR